MARRHEIRDTPTMVEAKKLGICYRCDFPIRSAVLDGAVEVIIHEIPRVSRMSPRGSVVSITPSAGTRTT